MFGPAVFVVVAATLAGVYFATQVRYAYAMSMIPPWRDVLTINLTAYYLWGAAVPLVVAVARRFPLESGRWLAHLVPHAAASVVITLAQLAAADLLTQLLGSRPGMTATESVLKSIRFNFHSSLPTYWLILFAYSAWDYYKRYRDRELRASELEAELADAQLEALRAQLRPHFLFNTLNSISSLMYSDVEAADRMMTRLSDLLRRSLETNARQEISLGEEMEILGCYLEIEKVRFEERLDISIDLETEALAARVPAFSLQPIVENAMRHAIAPRPEGGRLAIRARKDDGLLRISIQDDGPGLRDATPQPGVGLANVRARLERLYGSRQTLTLAEAPGGGLTVELSIPFHVTEGL